MIQAFNFFSEKINISHLLKKLNTHFISILPVYIVRTTRTRSLRYFFYKYTNFKFPKKFGFFSSPKKKFGFFLDNFFVRITRVILTNCAMIGL